MENNNKDNDPWTFTDNIKVYNWESHPEWNLCPINITGISMQMDQISHYHREREHLYMVECKRILISHGCLGWDNILKRNIFKNSESWEKNKFFPVELSGGAKTLYRINYPYSHPILTYSVNVPNDVPYIDIRGTWKIYYSGGSDTGSMYVDSIDNFKKRARECYKPFQMMYFPAVYINNPQFLMEKNRNDESVGIIYQSVSNYKVCIE